MTVTAPETEAREALIALLGSEFAAEQFPVRDDKLHGSVGHRGTQIGVSPLRTVSWVRDRLVNEIEILVQFYGKYDLKIDPEQRVSPKKIENYAERFRRALKDGDPNTSGVWYFTLDRIEFIDDPTGNRSRFEAYVRGRGNNASLIETTG